MFVVLLSFLFVQGSDLKSARDLYLEAVDGAPTLDRSSQLFQTMARENPSDALPMAYLGGLRLLESRRAIAPWTKGKLAREGMNMLNRAVAMAPDNMEVRFLRGSASYNLPSFMGVTPQAESDLTLIAPVAVTAAREGRLDPRMAAASLFYYGEIRWKKGDRAGATSAWRDAVRAGPQTVAGKDAAKKLADNV